MINILGEELINEFAQLINKSASYCLETIALGKDKENKVSCSKCAFARYYSLSYHGCFLIELYENGTIEILADTMRYHKLDTKILDDIEVLINE